MRSRVVCTRCNLHLKCSNRKHFALFSKNIDHCMIHVQQEAMLLRAVLVLNVYYWKQGISKHIYQDTTEHKLDCISH